MNTFDKNCSKILPTNNMSNFFIQIVQQQNIIKKYCQKLSSKMVLKDCHNLTIIKNRCQCSKLNPHFRFYCENWAEIWVERHRGSWRRAAGLPARWQRPRSSQTRTPWTQYACLPLRRPSWPPPGAAAGAPGVVSEGTTRTAWQSKQHKFKWWLKN